MLFSRRRNKIAIAGLAAYASALTVAVTWFILNQISRTEIEEARRAGAMVVANGQRQTATVVIPANVGGRCRHLEFDNITGAVRESTSSLCNDDTVTGNTTQGRLTAIRDAFAKR
jgi:hypothetical protein